jgi:hypothetical protein
MSINGSTRGYRTVAYDALLASAPEVNQTKIHEGGIMGMETWRMGVQTVGPVHPTTKRVA